MRQAKTLACICAFTLLALTFWGCAIFHFGETKLVDDGKPCADIVISDKPPRAVKLAAAELQTYIEKISGAKLAIVNVPGNDVTAHIYVGRSEYTDKFNISDEGLKCGAFRIVSGKDWLALLGHDKNFVFPPYVHRSYDDIQRATKEWDERTGEHWGNPFWGMRLYRQYNAKVGVSDCDEHGTLNAVYEFLRGLGVRWYMPGDLGEIVPERKTIAIAAVDKTVSPDFGYRNLGDYSPTFDAGTQDAIMYRLRLGLEPITGLPGPHGMNDVNGREEVKKAHPEFYRNHQTPAPNDLYFASCFSSPELFDYTVKYARALFDIYPDIKAVSFWPNDGFSMCQCDLCKGKETPQRGGAGVASDYVWDFVERVARELYKTHPDRKVICGAYGAYTLPPEKIAKFSPNVMVGIMDTRSYFKDPEVHARALETRKGFQGRVMPGNLYTYNHYLDSPSRLPSYFPHVIAEDLHSLKGISEGDYIELAQGQGATGMHAPGFNHLNVYVTARYYWDADQDIEALLNEYYEKFYGPAAKEMKAFIEYSEANWQRMDKEADAAARALELLSAARKAAGDTVYGKRVDLLVEYCKEPLTQLRDRLARGRDKDLPKIQAMNYDAKKTDIKLDGKFYDKLWKDAVWLWFQHGSLSEVETGRAPYMGTSFTVGWADNALYLGITCAERDPKGMKIGTAKNDDMALYDGDFVELLLETQVHSYYRIAIAPNGVMLDADMKTGAPETVWSSKVEASTYIGDGFWSVEMRIPMDYDVAKAVDPLNGVVGYKPTDLYPFSVNLCRQRVRKGGIERSAFSPTGKPGFYELEKFGKMIVR